MTWGYEPADLSWETNPLIRPGFTAEENVNAWIEWRRQRWGNHTRGTATDFNFDPIDPMHITSGFGNELGEVDDLDKLRVWPAIVGAGVLGFIVGAVVTVARWARGSR